jgi:hypothetical protein
MQQFLKAASRVAWADEIVLLLVLGAVEKDGVVCTGFAELHYEASSTTS